MELLLRKKFVIVTMSMMCIVTSIFFVCTHFYYQYWFDMDTLKFVRWITDSGVLLKHIRNIIFESERMSRLIERLLTLSRLDENAIIPQTAFSLSSCVEEMALTYESVAYDKGAAYSYDIAENISFYGNEDDIRQLMAILIDNAIKNTEPSGNISISLTENMGRITIKVENTGKGISAEDIPHIFERFYKSDSSRSECSFGLGLAIAKAVAERNSGSISVQSEVDGVTCFMVEFK